MSRKPLTLVHGILIATVTLLAPGIGLGQDQNPAPASAPPQAVQAQPDNAPAQQPAAPSTVITPSETKAKQEPPAATAPAAAAAPETYIVKQGDTLWDISNAILRDPFLWPFLWKANPFITNADLIYPGNKLTIPSMAPIEQAMEAPIERAQPKEQPVEQAAGTPAAAAPIAQTAPKAEEEVVQNRLILPEEKPLPLLDKYSLLSAGFVSNEESSDRITGSLDGKTILGAGDMVYVKIKSKNDAEAGNRYIIFQPLDSVKHPVSGRGYGKLTQVLGVLQLVEKGKDTSSFTARIIYSFDSASVGNMLTPYQEPTLLYKEPEFKQKDLAGYILQVVDGRTINGQIDVVYLDKGSSEGVEMGDRFLVYAKTTPKAYPRKLIGEVQVFIVKEKTATAMVRKSTEPLERGDPIEYRKQ